MLLVLSMNATCFGRTDRPWAFKYITLKQNQMHIYICVCVWAGTAQSL
jgi:hypothetical protein